MKIINYFLFFLIFVTLKFQIVNSISPPLDEYNCLINVINKYNIKEFDSYKDITKICTGGSYVACSAFSGNITTFILSVQNIINSNLVVTSSDFTCLPNLEILGIYYQNVTKELIYHKFPQVTRLTFLNVEVVGGLAIDQPFPQYNYYTLSSKSIDPNTPFKFSYFNKINRFSMSGGYPPLEVDTDAFRNKTFFHLSGKNYPDLTGYTSLIEAEFDFDETFLIASVSNFSKYANTNKLTINHGLNNNRIPFYFGSNIKVYTLWLTSSAGVSTIFETPTAMIDLSSTRITDFIMGNSQNFNFNGKFPLIMPTGCSRIVFSSNNLSFVPNDVVCSMVTFSNNGLKPELPKYIGKSSSIDLSYNQITGTIDSSWCSTELVINSNKLVGKIPSCFSCYLNAPRPVPGYLPAMYDRFTGNGFTNLNKTGVTCPTFAPQVKYLSSNSISVTGIDIGYDPYLWTINGGIKVTGTMSLVQGQYQMLTLNGAITGPTFTMNFQYPTNTIFTFPVVVKSPLPNLVTISGNGKIYTFNGTYFSSLMTHLNQDIRVKGSLCNILSTDFYSVVCDTSPYTISPDSTLKIVNITTGIKKRNIFIRTDGLVTNDHRCPNDCSDNQGVCDLSTGNCYCEPGYSGTDCSSKNCPVPDCNGAGSCNGTTGKCVCDSTHVGNSCQYTTSECPNGCGLYGTCNTNKTCTCPNGYGGVDCSQLYDCVSENCSGNGICNRNTGICECFEGYGTNSCGSKILACPNGPNGKFCSGVGSCPSDTGICSCYTGYQGAACDQKLVQCPLANSKVCNGLDINWCDNTIGKCNCNPNSQGVDCTLPFIQCPIVNGKLCSGFGSCNNQTGVCSCDSSHQSNDCSKPFIQCPTINSNDCSGYGKCNNQTGICTCDSTHQSVDCNLPFIQCPIVNGKLCNGYGGCNNQNGVCSCDSSHQSNDCSKPFIECPTINSNDCSGYGKCNNQTGVCTCDVSHQSSDCSKPYIQCPIFSGSACGGSSRGTCDTFTGVCSCEKDFQSGDCSKPFIKCPNDCNGFGLCNNETGICACSSDRTLSDCSGKQCSVPNCNNNGTCDYIVGLCKCDSSHQGIDCDVSFVQCPNNCSGFGKCNNVTGECTCNSDRTLSDCSGKQCSVPNCNNHGTCDYIVGLCKCDSSHQGNDCDISFTHCPNDCSGFGECNNITGSCSCDSAHYSTDCSKSFIQCQNECSGFGACNNLTGICECEKDRLNLDCSGKQCSVPNCNNHGTCDYTVGLCQCDSSHQGIGCGVSLIRCPNDCSGFGKCNNVTGECTCNSDRTLSNCSGIQCSVPTCNNHGTCDTSIGKCKCLEKTWAGSDCLIPYQVIISVNESTTAGGEASFEGVFGNVHQGISLEIGGKNCPIFFNSSTIIKCMAPAGNGVKIVSLFQNDINYTYNKYKYKPIELSCPSNCLGNGICNTITGECQCNTGFGSFDCSPFIIGGGGLSETNSKSGSDDKEIIIPPKTNTTVNEETGGTNIVNQQTNFQIFFKSLYEIDYNGEIIKTYQLQNNWVVSNDSNINGQYSFSQTIENGCTITSKIQEISDENGKQFEFAGTVFTVSNGGIKFTITIDNYQYQNNLNTLNLDFISSVDEIQNQDNPNNECNSKDTEIDTTNVNDLSNFNYIKISKNNKILSGRFINRLISDGKPTFFSTSVKNETNSIIVSLNLPHCTQCIIDPDFSVLLSTGFKSNCPSVVDQRKSYVIPVSVVASVVGVAAIGSAGFLIKKKMLEKKIFSKYSK